MHERSIGVELSRRVSAIVRELLAAIDIEILSGNCIAKSLSKIFEDDGGVSTDAPGWEAGCPVVSLN